ncbi:MAG: alcohol dehydrogenase catalytic domain-containing protein [Eubacteriales bacterium]|nr:alcohol dehydrogenase catalytic domain-containing protein [Eubacteriales bacterium]
MKAAVWHGYKDVRIQDVPIPVPGPDQVLIRINYAGICGTDRHEYVGPNFIPTTKPHRLTGRKAPLIIGHEFSGTVAALGDSVEGYVCGEAVTANGSLTCGSCEMCQSGRYNICKKLGFVGVGDDGCFAEYLTVDADKVFRIPEGVTQRQAAVAEPLACGIHATHLVGDLMGKRVVVVGAGIIGIGAFYGAKLAGAREVLVVGRSEEKRSVIEQNGGRYLNTTDKDLNRYVEEWSDGQLADVVYECAGTQETLDLCIPVCKPGGTIMVMGVFEKPPAVDMNTLQEAERKILTSQAHINELGEALAYIAQGKINADELITKEVLLDDLVEEGFEELILHSSQHIKILIRINE